MIEKCTARTTNEAGSITLEAAIALPVFIVFFLFLSWLMTLAATEAALRDAVNETVKSVSSYAYPVDLLLSSSRNEADSRQLEQLMQQVVPISIQSLLDRNVQTIASLAVPLLMNFVDRNGRGEPLLERENLTVTNVVIPSFTSDEQSYFGMTVEYRVSVPFSFNKKEIVLVATAAERCWVGAK